MGYYYISTGKDLGGQHFYYKGEVKSESVSSTELGVAKPFDTFKDAFHIANGISLKYKRMVCIHYWTPKFGMHTKSVWICLNGNEAPNEELIEKVVDKYL